MAKRATTFGLTLPPRDADLPAYRWLYESLRGEILGGRLRPGARLPATRELAREYGLSRGTIINAFDQLRSEGYVEGSVGSGTYVSKILPDDLFEVGRKSPVKPELRPARVRNLSDYASRVRFLPGIEHRRSRAFRSNLPAIDQFPSVLWAQIAYRRLQKAPMSSLISCDAMGYRPLREAISNYLVTSRGVKCQPEQIVVVAGAQDALDMTTRLLLNPGDKVCMEDPGYAGALGVFESIGADVVSIPLDEQGIQLQEQSLHGARLIYVTPGHQFPVGITMSLPRRLALLEAARKFGAIIFEDDYDSEYRYSGRPVPALQGLDRDGLVIFAGTFSKVLFPSLRLGYLVVPADLVPTFEAARSMTMRHIPLLEQAVLCDFIVEGHFGRHLRRMRQVYAERLSVLLESAEQHLAGLLEISSIQAGLQTVGWLADGIDDVAAAKSAAGREVEVTALSAYSRLSMSRKGLQLGFAAVDTGEIRRGVRDLAVALEGLRSNS